MWSAVFWCSGWWVDDTLCAMFFFREVGGWLICIRCLCLALAARIIFPACRAVCRLHLQASVLAESLFLGIRSSMKVSTGITNLYKSRLANDYPAFYHAVR